MNREDIIQMAQQAGFVWLGEYHSNLEDFAKLVAEHTLSNIDPSKFMSYQEGMEAGRLAEREACAKLCDEFPDIGYIDKKLTSDYHAHLIRQRGQA